MTVALIYDFSYRYLFNLGYKCILLRRNPGHDNIGHNFIFLFSIHMGTYFQSPIFAYAVHIYLCNFLETKDNIGLMSSSHELVMEFRTFLFKDRL